MSTELICQVAPSDFYGYFYESIAILELGRRGLRHTFLAQFTCPARFPEVITARRLIASESDSRGKAVEELREWDNGLISLSVERSAGRQRTLSIRGYFASRGEARQCLSEVRRVLPAEIDRTAENPGISFWHAAARAGCHPERETQKIAAPGWIEIAANYPEGVRRELARVMAVRAQSAERSRLMLWRGLPGTGKTWAIRALAREWAGWCDLHYVIDSAGFFRNESYMLSLLAKLRSVDDDEGDEEEDAQRRWNLLVLEDAGEFIAMDSRQQYGQALAKLLNLTDGLFGQGLRFLVLITTNEELRNLHPAIVRSGRCLSNVEFSEFGADEARKWLRERAAELHTLPERLTLSDLYAALDRHAAIANGAPARRAGFLAR